MTRHLSIEITSNKKVLVKTLERFDGKIEWVPKLFDSLKEAESFVHEVLFASIFEEVTK